MTLPGAPATTWLRGRWLPDLALGGAPWRGQADGDEGKLPAMAFERLTVFLPCHSLDDFPTWLDDREANSLLAAWSAAWHPWLIASVGAAPGWSSVDLPPPADAATLGIVPQPWDDRFAVQSDALLTGSSRWIRGVDGLDAIVAAAAATIASTSSPASRLPGGGFVPAFRALGLAALLAELLGRRMRSHGTVFTDDFTSAVVQAARAAVADEQAQAQKMLRECFASLETARATFYPVDVWLVDLVLLAPTTLGPGLDRELESPVPLTLVATGSVVEKLAGVNPPALERIRERMRTQTLELAGGRHDCRPLDACTPEEILDSFDRGRAAWREHLGISPSTYAQVSGGSSAILPQMLCGCGFTGAVWTLFDGSPLPDPAAGRIRWEGTGGACIDAIGGVPVDARSAKSILSLPGRIGDAMDHEHTVVVPFAHHAGTGSSWYDDLRQAGAHGTALGTFVTAGELFARTPGAGTTVSFSPDAYPPTLPAGSLAGDGDAVGAAVAAARETAGRLIAERQRVADLLPAPFVTVPLPQAKPERRGRRLFPAIFSRSSGRDGELVLENGLLRVQVHPRTGGILAVRRPVDRGNRLSQRLALRTTRPAPEGGRPWEDPAERAEYSDMVADAIVREPASAGRGERIVCRGRLLKQQQELGTFTQKIELSTGLPLAIIEIDVRPTGPLSGPLWEHHLACRFAWNENDDVELRRSVHSQAVVTDRGRFSAPWFVDLRGSGLSLRPSAGSETADGVTIVTGGLPWHVRAGGHMLDSILPGDRGCQPVRLGIGVGLERPWDAALALLTATDPEALGCTGPANVRITVGPLRREGDRIVAARIGILEAEGRAGEARIEWRREVARARVCDVTGRDCPAGSGAGAVAVEGRVTTVVLRRYEWLHLDVEFSQ